VTLEAVYRPGGRPVPPAGSAAPSGGADRLTVLDALGNELLSAVAPPFVSTTCHQRYAGVVTRLPGVHLDVEWSVRRWPVHGTARWRQVFRDGVEQAGGAPHRDTGAAVDLAISCDYRDLGRFLLGAGPITNASAPVRVEKGGFAELSCLVGLILGDDASLRAVALPATVRGLLAEALLQL
jgi:hypothetical protein